MYFKNVQGFDNYCRITALFHMSYHLKRSTSYFYMAFTASNGNTLHYNYYKYYNSNCVLNNVISKYLLSGHFSYETETISLQ